MDVVHARLAARRSRQAGADKSGRHNEQLLKQERLQISFLTARDVGRGLDWNGKNRQ